VVHLDLPDNLEAYFQEAGRAGRDQQKAFAVLLWEKADIADLQKNFELSYPGIGSIKRVYQALGNYYHLAVGSGKGESFDFDLSDFARNYQFQVQATFSALKFLEREGYILLNEGVHEPPQIHIRLNGNDLYKFQVANSRYDIFIKFLLRTYSGLFDGFVRISPPQIARTFQTKVEQVHLMLLALQKLEVIEYKPEKTKPQLIFIEERLPADALRISPEVYKTRKELAQDRMKAVIDYTTTVNKCRNQLLLAYFGENIGKRCGKCDVCLRRNSAELSELQFDYVVEIIKPLLLQKHMLLEELLYEAEFDDVDKLLSAISWLRDNDKILEDAETKLYWNTSKD